MKNNSTLTSYLYVTLSGILFGILIFGGGVMKAYGFSLIEVMTIPALIVTVVLFWFARKDLKSFYSVPTWISVTYFIFNTIGQVSQYAPLFLGVSVSLTLFILYTQPIWTILISTIFLKEKFTKKDALVTIVIILGLVFLLAPWQKMTYSIAGIAFAVVSGIQMSAWILFTSHFSRKNIKPITTTFYINLYTSIPFILAVPLIARFFPDPAISALSFDKPIITMFCVFIFAVTVCIGARLFFCKGASKINNIHLGLILLIEPVVGTILDITFLDNTLTWNIVVGGSLIILGNAILITKSSGNKI